MINYVCVNHDGYSGLTANCPSCNAKVEGTRSLTDIRECDEAAKPETGPMRNAESPSGVQELGSSGLALAISDITDLRDSARNVESSEKDHLMWLWRGKAIAYETVLGRLSRLCEGSEAQ